MKSIYRVFRRAALAVVVGLASLPIALLSANSVLGIASSLVVPVFFVATVFTIIARTSGHRIWWFAFACGTAACLLFLSQLLETGVHHTALYLQRLSCDSADIQEQHRPLVRLGIHMQRRLRRLDL